jgi:hypothetical protein
MCLDRRSLRVQIKGVRGMAEAAFGLPSSELVATVLALVRAITGVFGNN